LLAYLRSVDRLHVADRGPITIAGRRAVRVDLTVESEGSGCASPSQPHLLLWRDTAPNGDVAMQVPEGSRVPVSILDVDDATIAIEIWSGDTLESWLPTAETIVGSIRFLYRPPDPFSPSPATP
jgi:hypothetical protein